MAINDQDKIRIADIKKQIASLRVELSDLRKRCDPHPNAVEVNLRNMHFIISPLGDRRVVSYKCPDCGSRFKRYESW